MCNWVRPCLWLFMVTAAMWTMVNLYLYPLLEITTLNYQPRAITCGSKLCAVESPCIVNNSVIGKDFDKVFENYSLPVGAIVSALHFLMLMRIFGAKFMTSTCGYFVVFMLPARFAYLIMQLVEFKQVGGDMYTQLIWNPQNFQCDLFSGQIDAVTLMHLRFYLLVSDFVTLHILTITVPLYFAHDGTFSSQLAPVKTMF